MKCKFRSSIIILMIIAAVLLAQRAQAAIVESIFSTTKLPCKEEVHKWEEQRFLKEIRYYCYDEQTVRFEQEGNVSRYYDRRGRLREVFEMEMTGIEVISNKFYYENGNLRAEGGFRKDLLIYDEAGTLKVRYDGSRFGNDRYRNSYGEIYFYDNNGNVIKQQKGEDYGFVSSISLYFMNLDAEVSIKQLAAEAEIYAQAHDGEYPPTLPKTDKYIPYSICDSGGYGFSLECTNTTSGYLYKALPIDNCDYCKERPRSGFVIQTGEIFKETLIQ